MATTFAPWAKCDRPDARSSRSPDGVIVVTMQRVPGGLFVERVIQRPKVARVVQAATFPTPSSFHHWCAADPARFEFPLLYTKLEHDAEELFADHAEAHVAG